MTRSHKKIDIYQVSGIWKNKGMFLDKKWNQVSGSEEVSRGDYLWSFNNFTQAFVMSLS